MNVNGIEGMTVQELHDEIRQGGRFVYYTYAISILVMTFQRPSEIHYIRPGESSVMRGMGCTVLSLVAGWWGIPWGPIYTIGSLVTNLSGGKDVTQEVLAGLS